METVTIKKRKELVIKATERILCKGGNKMFN
jgi:hypothetical protein